MCFANYLCRTSEKVKFVGIAPKNDHVSRTAGALCSGCDIVTQNDLAHYTTLHHTTHADMPLVRNGWPNIFVRLGGNKFDAAFSNEDLSNHEDDDRVYVDTGTMLPCMYDPEIKVWIVMIMNYRVCATNRKSWQR